VLVMYQGRIVGEVDPHRVAQEEIGLMMTGGKKSWRDFPVSHFPVSHSV